jgi:hypothetical protein
MLMCFWLGSVMAMGQGPGVHYLHQGIMPPGAIGSLQLQRGGPLPGYFQPVEIKAPSGTSISLAEGGAFAPADPSPVVAGMLIGQVYRLRVTNIPLYAGLEVFPTVEVINRLYPPVGQEARFPIVIDLTLEDILLAANGKFVTRVIYLEDPKAALPVRGDPRSQEWFEVSQGDDPLAVADQLGRPMAILRIGARLPDAGAGLDPGFLFGCPSFVRYSRVDQGPSAQPPSPSPASTTLRAAERVQR